MDLMFGGRFLLTATAAAALFMCGCGKEAGAEKKAVQEAPGAARAEAEKYPEDVVEKLDKIAGEYFGGNGEVAKEWKKRQLKAYSAINSIVPEIPLQKFFAIKSFAEKKFPDDYVEQHRHIYSEIDFYKALEAQRDGASAEAYEYSLGAVERFFPDDYKAQSRELARFCAAFKLLENVRSKISPDAFAFISAEALEKCGGNPLAAESYVRDQLGAKSKIDSFRHKTIDGAALDAAKGEVAATYPGDYVSQYAELVALAEAGGEKKKPEGEKPAAAPEADSALEKAKKVFRESMFTKRGADEDIFCAALVEMNGKPVILCAKEFVPQTMPAVFANSRGKITCSKAFVAEGFPLVLMVPDEVPAGFRPLKLLSDVESADFGSKRLYMIAPDRGGFRGMPVEVFSEDAMYLNLAADSNPTVSREIDVKFLGRDAKKMQISLTDSISVGENSVVLDSDSGALVSLALRIYSPGSLDEFGKTGSVIGHENAEIPDYNSFVRLFDGQTQRTVMPPTSSIRFVRMGALESWMPLDIEKLNYQRTSVRKFTDDNNDFLAFFRENTFNNALRSRRLGRIAEKYKKPLVEENLGRDAYERQYKSYMMEVLFAIKRELLQFPNADGFYSIYKNELEYQIGLRKAMHDYLAECIKDGEVFNAIHLDLKSRLNGSERSGMQIRKIY